ncbi:hypothetical protein M0R89_09230 [Halorussus limi]|uniref:Uncharacterized protein n=1 Tax=Halorussus limi TaxID=2938695 RepID=A0A8U0HP54_9EURY|nr:hypothetical protein [Halorussus limi]UPV72730.1 hypothetical protein M0R89_09230 [Halorussus limi]
MSLATGLDVLSNDSGWPTTEELQSKLTRKIREYMSNGAFTVMVAPTSTGKTYNGATTNWTELPHATGDEPVVHLHYSTDARDKAVRKSNAHDIDYHRLLGRGEACNTYSGDYDGVVNTPTGEPASEWMHKQMEESGNTLSKTHQYLEDYNDGDLPCCPCPSIEQWSDIPRDDDGDPAVDVVHAQHNFAYVPSLVQDVNMIWDELPSFKRSIGDRNNDDMTRAKFQDIVTAWLKKIDAPVKTWEMFVTMADDGLESLYEVLDDPPQIDPDWFIENDSAHTLAPALTKAMYRALNDEPGSHGRRSGYAVNELSRFDANDDDDFRYSRNRITVVVDNENRPQAYWDIPEMGNARSIICLDAWPSIHEWRMNIGDGIKFDTFIDDEAFTQWRVNERGLEVVQIGTGAKPASSDYAVTHNVDETAEKITLEMLRYKYGDDFESVISTNAMEPMVEQLVDGEEVMPRGSTKSNGAFSHHKFGYVTHSIDPGDDYVLDLLAARGLDAAPLTLCGPDCGGDECPVCEGNPERVGRAFEGPDADKAKKILDAVRKNSTAQAIGRYAREDDSPRALVFVRTSMIPDGMVDTTISTPTKYTEKQKAVVNYLRENPASSATEIVSVSGTHDSPQGVRQFLSTLMDVGLVNRGPSPQKSNEYLYMLDGDIPEDGYLDLTGI